MQEGGQVHQTVHMHGDIALSMNAMPRKKDTMAEGRFSSLSKLPCLAFQTTPLKIKPCYYQSKNSMKPFYNETLLTSFLNYRLRESFFVLLKIVE